MMHFVAIYGPDGSLSRTIQGEANVIAANVALEPSGSTYVDLTDTPLNGATIFALPTLLSEISDPSYWSAN